MRSLLLKFVRQPRDPHVGWLQIAAYGGVNLPVAILHAPVLSVLPALYAEVAHIDLVAIGAILAITRIGDAVLDTAIGLLSDRIATPWGRRKPWILLGALICALAAYFLFRPGPATGAVYFAAGYFALYLGWTLVEIPHTAWASDMTADGIQRTRLFASRNFMGALGGVVFMAIPLLPIWPSTRITPTTMALSSWVMMLLLAPLTLAALVVVPREAQATRRPSSLLATLREMARSRLFRRYLLISGAPGLASGMVAGLYYFYIDVYLKAGAGFAIIGLMVAAISIVATPLWPPMIQRIGERRTIALFSLSTIVVLTMMLLDRPGPLAFPVVLAAFAISALFGAGLDTALATLLSEIVDQDTAAGGDRASGGYFAAQAFLSKVTLAAGGGLSLVLVGLFGFHPAQPNGSLAMAGFFAALIAAPMILHAITAVLAWTFPATTPAQPSTPIRAE